MRGLPKEWDVKTMAMREAKDLNQMELHELFENLKAYEFELQAREDDQSTSQATKALTVIKADSPAPVEKSAEQLSNDAMALFVRKFGKFMRKNQGAYKKSYQKKDSVEDPNACFNCGKLGHFAADCNKPKKNEKRSAEKGKGSSDRRRKFKGEKKSYKKNHEVLVADEGKSKWADSSDESSDSEASSSSSDEEEVKCLMANDDVLGSTSEQVFDFNSEEFTREELCTALHEMVEEYQKLTLLLNETKAKQNDLQSSSTETSWDQSREKLNLEAEIVKLNVENDKVKTENQTLKDENQRLSELIEVWNKASKSLDEMQGLQKSVGDMTGIGFKENCEASASSSKPTIGLKGKYIHFVKSTMAQEPVKPIQEVKQPVEFMNKNKRFGIGFAPESSNSRLNWKPKATSRVRNNSMTGRSYNYFNSKPVQKRYRLNDVGKAKQHSAFNTNRAHYSQNFAQPRWIKTEGRSVRLTQVWVPKGLISSGPK